ncbi:hypothetical protein [Pontibacter sp. H249]|uniref:hypothetical protein n=1 Tax=Pontibacter sp. H249 TaxID=3133420 RepID=UPI0030BE9FC2
MAVINIQASASCANGAGVVSGSFSSSINQDYTVTLEALPVLDGPEGYTLDGGTFSGTSGNIYIEGLENRTYTLRVTGANGDTETQPVTIACGPNYPADGTFLRNDCNGYDLQQVLADGSGGERWGNVVEQNSSTCGYVPEPEPEPEPVLGCTDPEADNYNPNATPGNAQANACTYPPKIFTEVKVVEVTGCTKGVCLRWFNNLGGIDTWVFSGKVDRPFASEASGEFSYANGLKAAASKAGQPTMTLRTANLSYDRYQALWQLFTSPMVWIHHPDNSTEEVYVLPAAVPAMPLGRNSYDLTVEISKAPINTLRR